MVKLAIYEVLNDSTVIGQYFEKIQVFTSKQNRSAFYSKFVSPERVECCIKMAE